MVKIVVVKSCFGTKPGEEVVECLGGFKTAETQVYFTDQQVKQGKGDFFAEVKVTEKGLSCVGKYFKGSKPRQIFKILQVINEFPRGVQIKFSAVNLETVEVSATTQEKFMEFEYLNENECSFFFIITSMFQVECMWDVYESRTERMRTCKNYFATKEEAEKAVEALLKHIEESL